MRKNGVFGLLVILTVFIFFGCGGDDEPKIYTVTIGTLTNANGSTITVNPTSGVEGTEITLIIYEDNTYRLKSGTLKYGETAINETTLKFNLPAENVVINAEFHSLLIGDWKYNEFDGAVITFFEDGIYAVKNNNGYYIKGLWNPESNNKIILSITNYKINGGGYVTINDFTESDVLLFDDFFCEIITNNTIKIIWVEGDPPEYYTLLE